MSELGEKCISRLRASVNSGWQQLSYLSCWLEEKFGVDSNTAILDLQSPPEKTLARVIVRTVDAAIEQVQSDDAMHLKLAADYLQQRKALEVEIQRLQTTIGQLTTYRTKQGIAELQAENERLRAERDEYRRIAIEERYIVATETYGPVYRQDEIGRDIDDEVLRKVGDDQED